MTRPAATGHPEYLQPPCSLYLHQLALCAAADAPNMRDLHVKAGGPRWPERYRPSKIKADQVRPAHTEWAAAFRAWFDAEVWPQMVAAE